MNVPLDRTQMNVTRIFELSKGGFTNAELVKLFKENIENIKQAKIS